MSRARPGRLRRGLRAVALFLVLLFVGVTVQSLVLNAATVPPRELTAPTGSDVHVNGMRVHYQRWGTNGPPIVLVHGFMESTVAWRPSAPLLAARGYQVYAVDLAGYGYTQYTGHYTLQDEAALVTGFIRTLHLDKPVLVGHSLGAAVVGRVALDQPSMLRGVIFHDGDALPFRGGNSNNAVASVIMHSPYVLSAFRTLGYLLWFDHKVLSAVCGSVCPAATPALVAAWMRPMHQQVAEEALLRIGGQQMIHLTPQQVQAITVPRGIIWGAEDATGGGSLAGAQTNLHQPTTVVLPRAGHLSMVADPSGFAAAVDRLTRGAALTCGQTATNRRSDKTSGQCRKGNDRCSSGSSATPKNTSVR